MSAKNDIIQRNENTINHLQTREQRDLPLNSSLLSQKVNNSHKSWSLLKLRGHAYSVADWVLSIMFHLDFQQGSNCVVVQKKHAFNSPQPFLSEHAILQHQLKHRIQQIMIFDCFIFLRVFFSHVHKGPLHSPSKSPRK